MVRKSCKECPWKNSNRHNDAWKKYVEKMKSSGISPQGHNCHMITSDVWGLREKITEKTICVGGLDGN